MMKIIPIAAAFLLAACSPPKEQPQHPIMEVNDPTEGVDLNELAAFYEQQAVLAAMKGHRWNGEVDWSHGGDARDYAALARELREIAAIRNQEPTDGR